VSAAGAFFGSTFFTGAGSTFFTGFCAGLLCGCFGGSGSSSSLDELDELSSCFGVGGVGAVLWGNSVGTGFTSSSDISDEEDEESSWLLGTIVCGCTGFAIGADFECSCTHLSNFSLNTASSAGFGKCLASSNFKASEVFESPSFLRYQ